MGSGQRQVLVIFVEEVRVDLRAVVVVIAVGKKILKSANRSVAKVRKEFFIITAS